MHGKFNARSSKIDGTVGSTDIAEKFSGIYAQLYNKDVLGEECVNVRQTIFDRAQTESFKIESIKRESDKQSP